MARSSRWGSHRRFDLPIEGTDVRLVVGSYRGKFDFYITDRAATKVPKALGFGTERPTVWNLFGGLQGAGLSMGIAMRACLAVANAEPSLLDEQSNRERELELELLRRQVGDEGPDPVA